MREGIRIYRFILITLFIYSFCQCGVPDHQYQDLLDKNFELQKRIDTLSAQLNDLKFGPSSILKKAKLAIRNEQYDSAQLLLFKITNKYYQSKEATKAQNILKEIAPKIERAFYQKARNDTGIYSLQEYLNRYPDGMFTFSAKSIIQERVWNTLNYSSIDSLQHFVSAYPNSSHSTEAGRMIIRAEVDGIIQNADYKQLPSLTKDININSNGLNGQSEVTIGNRTGYSLTMLFSGPEQYKIKIGNVETRSMWLKSGIYNIVLYFDGNSSKYAAVELLDGVYSASYHLNQVTSTYNQVNTPTVTQPQLPYINHSNGQSNRSEYYNNFNQQHYKRRVGAICNDGTTSSATGRGACSHHGGVSQWLYE